MTAFEFQDNAEQFPRWWSHYQLRPIVALIALIVGIYCVAIWSRWSLGDNGPKGISVESLRQTQNVLGKTHEPLGKVVAVQGIVVSLGHCYDDPEPRLKVQNINGRIVSEPIELSLKPFRTKFGEPYYVLDMGQFDNMQPDPERSLPALECGQSYELVGFETAEFAGAPDEAMFDGGLCPQTRGFYFTSDFVVFKGKRLPESVSQNTP